MHTACAHERSHLCPLLNAVSSASIRYHDLQDAEGLKVEWGGTPYAEIFGPKGWCNADTDPAFKCPCRLAAMPFVTVPCVRELRSAAAMQKQGPGLFEVPGLGARTCIGGRPACEGPRSLPNGHARAADPSVPSAPPRLLVCFSAWTPPGAAIRCFALCACQDGRAKRPAMRPRHGADVR